MAEFFNSSKKIA